MYALFFATSEQRISTLCALLICGYALWRGGRPERWAAVMIAVDWFATPLLQGRHAFHHTEFAIFTIDGALAVGLTSMALSTNRFWPLWAAAFQVLELVMHIAMLVDHRVRPIAYFVGMELASYLILIALAVGTRLEGPHSKRLAV